MKSFPGRVTDYEIARMAAKWGYFQRRGLLDGVGVKERSSGHGQATETSSRSEGSEGVWAAEGESGEEPAHRAAAGVQREGADEAGDREGDFVREKQLGLIGEETLPPDPEVISDQIHGNFAVQVDLENPRILKVPIRPVTITGALAAPEPAAADPVMKKRRDGGRELNPGSSRREGAGTTLSQIIPPEGGGVDLTQLSQEGGKDRRGFIRFGVTVAEEVLGNLFHDLNIPAAREGKEKRRGVLPRDKSREPQALEGGGTTLDQSIPPENDGINLRHVTSHAWLEELRADAAREGAPEQLRSDWSLIAKALGLPETSAGEAIPTEAHEQFARQAEAYLMEGKAPTQELASAFARFKTWVAQISREIKRLGVTLQPEVHGVREVFGGGRPGQPPPPARASSRWDNPQVNTGVPGPLFRSVGDLPVGAPWQAYPTGRRGGLILGTMDGTL